MEHSSTVISVRGEARRFVLPDAGTMRCEVNASAADVDAAAETVVRVRDELLADLESIGAVRLTPETERAPLTVLVRAVSSGEFWRSEEDGGMLQRVTCSVEIAVRELDRLAALTDLVGARDHVDLGGLIWQVDDDNPAWPGLRAEALEVAIEQARQYAHALSGRVVAIQQVADAGLLTGGEEVMFAAQSLGRKSRSRGGRGSGLTVDVVPQEIRAVVEARCVAEVPPMSNG